MLIKIYDALTAGRRIRSIRFGPPRAGKVVNFGGHGIHVAHANAVELADAWIGVSKEGIWLTYNAEQIGPTGADGTGMQAQEEPLASIVDVVFVEKTGSTSS